MCASNSCPDRHPLDSHVLTIGPFQLSLSCTHSLGGVSSRTVDFNTCHVPLTTDVSPEVQTLSNPTISSSSTGGLLPIPNLMCMKLNSLFHPTHMFNPKRSSSSVDGNSILPVAQSKDFGVLETSFSIRKSYWCRFHKISQVRPLMAPPLSHAGWGYHQIFCSCNWLYPCVFHSLFSTDSQKDALKCYPVDLSSAQNPPVASCFTQSKRPWPHRSLKGTSWSDPC